MGQKDIAEKILEAYNDVFSDIVNVLLFDGKEVIKADELEDQMPRSAYKADGQYREIERDVAKRWKNKDIRLACIGLENQTSPDADMPLRIIAYDGAEYRAQLNQDKKRTDKDKIDRKQIAGNSGSANKNNASIIKRYPVVTLVLYFGHDKHWDKPLSLLERLEIPEEFKPYVNDYKINLFEIAYLNEETVKKFKSDFKIVADYFTQKQKTGNYIGSKDEIVHVQETLSLLSIMSGDHRFEDTYKDSGGFDRKGVHNMCEVLDRLIAEGEAKGEVRGEARGKQDMAQNMAKSLHDQGVDINVIAKAADVAVDVVLRWIGLENDSEPL